MKLIRKLILFLSFAFQLNTGFSQTQSYTLSGMLKGIPKGVVELISNDYRTRESSTINTGTIKDGKFSISGKLPSATMVRMVIKPGNWETQLFLENSKITIQVDTAGAVKNLYAGEVRSIALKNVVVKGSKTHDDYLRLGISQRSQNQKNSFETINQYIGLHPSSVAGAYVFEEHYIYNPGMDISKTEQVLSKFAGEAKKSIYAKNLYDDIAERKAVLPGNFAADFTLLTRDSLKVSLSDFKGRYVLLDFWASWCKPCRAAIPHWKEVSAKYKGKGLEIVSITLDSRRNDWLKAMDEEQMPWTQLTDEYPVIGKLARVFSTYKNRTIPFYVLLDKEGKILARTISEKEIDTIIENEL